MARVTVEDCMKVVKNKFELVVLSSKRGRDIAAGSPILVSRDNDKNAVIALREIAHARIKVPALRDTYLKNLIKKVKPVFAHENENSVSEIIEDSFDIETETEDTSHDIVDISNTELDESDFDLENDTSDSEVSAVTEEELSSTIFDEDNLDVRD